MYYQCDPKIIDKLYRIFLHCQKYQSDVHQDSDEIRTVQLPIGNLYFNLFLNSESNFNLKKT